MNYLSVKTSEDTYRHFEVPLPVYVYVKQLEAAVKTGDAKGIRELYPERFK